MRKDEAVLLGAMTGAVVVWLWGAKLENRVETPRVPMREDVREERT
jgi:hypothetical protein